MMITEQNTKAQKFLLGKLDEKEQAKIEMRYFRDKGFFEEILIAENELIDAYVTGRLDSDDKKLFEERLLFNPSQQKRAKFAETLIKYVSSMPTETPFDFSEKTSWTAFLSRIIFNKPLLSFSFAAAILVIFAAGIWISTNNSQNNQPIELAKSQIPQQMNVQPPVTNSNQNNEAVNAKSEITPPARRKNQNEKTPEIKPQKSPQTKTPIIFSFVLSSGLTRDSGASQKLTVPAKADFVNLRLNVEPNNFSSYRAILETAEGNNVWSSRNLKLKNNGKSIDVLIPSKLLKKADYILSIKAAGENGIFESLEDYSFTVEF